MPCRRDEWGVAHQCADKQQKIDFRQPLFLDKHAANGCLSERQPCIKWDGAVVSETGMAGENVMDGVQPGSGQPDGTGVSQNSPPEASASTSDLKIRHARGDARVDKDLSAALEKWRTQKAASAPEALKEPDTGRESAMKHRPLIRSRSGRETERRPVGKVSAVGYSGDSLWNDRTGVLYKNWRSDPFHPLRERPPAGLGSSHEKDLETAPVQLPSALEARLKNFAERYIQAGGSGADSQDTGFVTEQKSETGKGGGGNEM